MANPATITAPAKADGSAAPLAISVPFTRASFEHEEPFLDKSFVPSASASVAIGPEPVSAYGFMASLFIVVQSSGAVGAATFRPDAPYSILSDIVLQDINGAPIVGPVGGYDLYLINKWGGYEFLSDPATSPAFLASTANGNFGFALRIPVQLGKRDALGALPNMNSAATYQLRATLAPTSAIYSAAPATLPTSVRVTAHLHAWAQPPATSRQGAPQAQQPPGTGTTQYWTKNTMPVLLGNNTHRLTRQGQLVRNLIFVARDVSGVRSDTVFPNELRHQFDGQEIINRSKLVWQHLMRERGGQTLDTGVYVLDYTHDFTGQLGNEMRDLWWETEQSSKSELFGSWGAAGSLDVLTNDVAVAASPFVGA